MRKTKYSHDQHAFDDAASSEHAAYFVGLLMSDGAIVDRTVRLKLSGEDGVMVKKFRDFLKSNHPLHIVKPIGNYQKKTEISVSSPPLIEALAKYGVTPRKSFTAKVVGLENNRHFWRGMIDGDGSLAIRTHARCTSPIISLVGSKQTIFQFLSFTRSISEHNFSPLPSKSVWRLSVQSKAAAPIVHLLYENSTIALRRKFLVARQIMAADWSPKLKSWKHLTSKELLDLYHTLDGNWFAVARQLKMDPTHLRYTRRRLGIYQNGQGVPKLVRKLSWVTPELLLSTFAKEKSWNRVGKALNVSIYYLLERFNISTKQ